MSVQLHRAAVVAALGSFAFLVVVWILHPFVGGDTPFVLDGTNAFFDCIKAHHYNACDFTGKLNYWGLMSNIGWWPLLQHIPDAITIGLGGDGHFARTRVLAYLSVVGVVATVGLGWLVLTRVGQRAWFWGFLFVVIGGPVLAYGNQTAGEMLAMGLLVCLVAATVLRAPPFVVGLAALGACLTKETSYPFVVALGVLGLWLAQRRTGKPILRHLLFGAAGMAIAITAASLFNIVRFGSVLNTNYLDKQLRTPGVVRPLDYVAAVFFSPSGGLFFSWPAASVLVTLACLVALVRAPFGSAYARTALVVICCVVALTIGFASWWTPFGWSAYGPRLQLPWVPPLVLLCLVAYGDALATTVGRFLRSTWRLLLVVAVTFACALPSVGLLWDFGSLSGYWAQEQPECSAPWRSGLQTWHRCQHRLLWEHRPMPLYTVKGVHGPGGVGTAIVVGLGLLGCAVLLRGELHPAQQRPVSRTTGRRASASSSQPLRANP
jgi:hypothetical protein